MSNPTYEIVTFRAADGITDEDLRTRAADVQTWVAQQPGYRSRTLLRTGDGEYVDLVQWASLADAQAAAKLIGTAKAAGAFMQAINGPSVVMRHAAVALAFDEKS